MQKHHLPVLVSASQALDSYSLNQALAEQGVTNFINVAVTEDELVKLVVTNGYQIVVVDVIGLAQAEAVALIESLKSRTGCRLIAIGDNEQIAYYRAMLNAGAIEYVLNPLEITAFAEIDFSSASSESTNGKVISVVGAKGGVGASTVAVNLAKELSQRGETVSITDMDFSTGDLDIQFNVQGNTSLVEMLQYPERLEPVVYERSGITVSEGLTLFTGYLPLEESPFWPEKSAVDHFKKFCLNHSDRVILDLPAFALRDQVGFSALVQADIRVIVVEPTLASIRNAGQILTALDSVSKTHAEKQNIIVVNHTKSDKASLISCSDVQSAIGHEVDVVLPFAPSHFITKESLGRNQLKGNRRVSRAFAQLAQMMTDDDTQPNVRFWKRGA